MAGRKTLHLMVNGNTDIADTTQTLPSDWNATHVVGEECTNRTGGTLAVGDVVALDPNNDDSVFLDDTQAKVRPYVVTLGKLASGTGRSLVSANNLDVAYFACTGVRVTKVQGVVTRHNFLQKSATTKALEDTGVSAANAVPAGAVAVAMQGSAGGSATIDCLWLGNVTGSNAATTPASEMFRGVNLRTHPDADVAGAWFKVMLVKADEIVVNTGVRVVPTSRLVADITVSGAAGGLDTGTEQASTWYSIHYIRKSSDGTDGLLLHREKDYFLDQSNTTVNASLPLRDVAAETKIAQEFKTATTGLVEFVDVDLGRTGTPFGRVWFTIETDAAGLPSGTVLATSDKFDASLFATAHTYVRFPFRNPASLTASTVYHLVFQGDYTINASNYIFWEMSTGSLYANGQTERYDGTTWTNVGGTTDDFCFKIYVTRNDTAVTMPTGYDQRAKIGYVYNDGSSNFMKFTARDRSVRIGLSGGLASSGGVPSLNSLSALIPPGLVEVDIVLIHDTVGGDSWCAPVPDGYPGGGAGSMAVNLRQSDATAGKNIRAAAGSVATEYQAVYIYAASGNVGGNITGYIW